MVTTFSPPARPKKPKKSILPVVLMVVCGLLLAGLGYFFMQTGQQTARSAAMSEGVIKIAGAAGSEAVTPELLADPSATATALDALSEEISTKLANAERARTEAEQALTRVQAEVATAQDQLSTASVQTENVRRDLATRTSELAALQKSAGEESDRLKAIIKELQEQLDGVGEKEAGSAEAEPTDKSTAAAAEVQPSSDVAASPGPADDPDAAEASPKKSSKKSSAAIVPEGGSSLFKTVRYDAGKSSLTFITVDEQVLKYKNVPEETYDALLAAPLFDIYYRFRIMDAFESEPNDRDLLKTIRR